MHGVRTLPVIALTGYLGAGKTSLLNHVLRQPDARIGVVVNDFGEVNIDAALVAGQVDEPASISGGCICCVEDAEQLETAFERLSRRRLGLDAIIVEASGLADPLTLARIIRSTSVSAVRPGGLVDVVDAVTYLDTVDRDQDPPLRYAAASLVVVNKLDRVPSHDRDELVARIRERVHARNPRTQVVGAIDGRIDPRLLYDIDDIAGGDGGDAGAGEAGGGIGYGGGPVQLDLFSALPDAHPYDHQHADAVTVTGQHPAHPGRLVDLVENPPPGAYRIKGVLSIESSSGRARYLVNLVGADVHIARFRRPQPPDGPKPPDSLVAIGVGMDTADVRARLTEVFTPADDVRPVRPADLRRFERYRRLSR